MNDSEAKGRAVSAARMLAGLDQATLGTEAGVSPSTISNLERGNEVRDDTMKSVRRALKRHGVTLTTDTRNGMLIAALRYDNEDEDDDE